MTANNIRYFYNSTTGIELIYCANSAISYPLHNHISVLTIGIVLDGSVALTTNRDTNTYEKNDTFAIPPYVPHSISADKNYTMLSLCIDKNVVRHSSVNMVQNNIATLLTNTLSTKEISRYQIMLLLNCLNMHTDCSDWHDDIQSPFVNDLKRQLELCPESKLSIEEMAQRAYVSKYHLIRIFKAEVGLTPHQFQIQNRIRKAQRLVHKSKTIAEVALATGFFDQSHFIKQFEKYVGLSPLTYKASSDTTKPDIVD